MLDDTGLWRDVTELPSTLGETLDRRAERSEVAALVGGDDVRRIVASGPALARAAGLGRAEDVLADPAHGLLLDAAAEALGGVLAVLANALDPALIVLGGGLGGEPAFQERVQRACRARLAYPRTPALPVVPSRLGPDGGVVGAALVARGGRG